MTQRDYKRVRGGRSSGAPFSGWTGLGVGLAAGLAIAFMVWNYDHRSPEAVSPPPPAPQSAQDEGDPKEGTGTDFTFYDKLKNFEVVIPEKEKDVRPDLNPAPEQRPGTYVLQAGSYRNFADADRVRAQLALAGIESKIQKVTVDTDTWHRVRIGPISNLAELNRIRANLRRSDIDAIVIRVGD